MRAIELNIPQEADLTTAVQIIEAACAAQGLRPTLKGTVKKYPGCDHWHYKKDDQAGTLEVTLWQRRVWFKIAAGRQGAWIEPTVTRLQSAIERGLIFGQKGL